MSGPSGYRMILNLTEEQAEYVVDAVREVHGAESDLFCAVDTGVSEQTLDDFRSDAEEVDVLIREPSGLYRRADWTTRYYHPSEAPT